MKSESELAAVFCDRITLGALSGPGDPVQIVFMSPITTEGAVGQVPAFRAAMTREAFSGLVDELIAFRTQLTGIDQQVRTKSN